MTRERDGCDDDGEPERPVDKVIAAIITAIDAGQCVAPGEWVARYPEFAPDLEEFFADLASVGEQFRMTGVLDPTLAASVANGGNGAGGTGATTVDGPSADGRDPWTIAWEFGSCYTLLKRIGGGGQGDVWKAFQSNPDRLVAIKIVKGGYLASAEEVRRFRDETEIIARLDHPHIIPIYEVGEYQGHHYFSMKLMVGGSLAQRMADYRHRPEEAADLIIQISETVQHAHRHGVIHRDLKPSNILFDAEGRPYLTDFGLAKRFGKDVEATESGSIVGTAPYMSPEQASGKKGVTTASDVYGLGATLYAVLTGRPPFTGDSVIEILDQVREGNPVPPSKINPEVPRDLAAVCTKCLERSPIRRYETAQKVAEDLRNWRQGKPTVARPVGPPERLWKWCRRRPGLAAALSAVVVVAALGVVGIAWQLRETRKALKSEARTNYFYGIALAAEAWDNKNFGRAAELLERCPADLRGWEWNYLIGLRHLSPRQFKGHSQAIYSVAFSPDGLHLATASDDRTIKVWDAATGRLIQTFPGHEDTVRCVAFSPDGLHLASASWDGTVRVWDVATGKEVHRLVGHVGVVISVAYGDKGKYLASAGDDGFVRIWDAETGKPCPSIRAHENVILGVAYSPDGRSIASAGDDGVVKLWDAGDGHWIWTAQEKVESVRGVTFCPDGLHLALAGEDGAIRVLDARTGRRVLTTLGGHTDAVRGLAYSPDGARIASASKDGTVKLWDAASGQEAITLHDVRDVVVRGVAFSPDQNRGRLAAVYDDGSVCVWEAPRASSPGDAPRILRGHRGPIYGVSCSPDNQCIATAGGDRSVLIWGARNGWEAPLRTLTEHTGQVYAVAYSPDSHGRLLASAGADKVVRIWNTATGLLEHTLRGHTDDIWCVVYSPNGRFLASTDGVGCIKLWDVNAGQVLATFQHPKGGAYAAAFSPDGRLIAVGCGNGYVKVWDTRSKQSEPLRSWKDHDGKVYGIAFSPNGESLAAVGSDGFIRLWNWKTGKPGPVYPGSAQSDSLAFSPDGGYLAAALGDGTVKVWDARRDSPAPLLVLHGHTSRVLSVAFSPDGLHLVSAGFDGTARIWDTSSWPRPSVPLDPGR